MAVGVRAGFSSANITPTCRLTRAVDSRVGPVRLPAIQIRTGKLLRGSSKALPLQGRVFGVANTALHFALSIRIGDAARQGDGPVVSEQIAVERVQRRIINPRVSALLRRGCRARRFWWRRRACGRLARAAQAQVRVLD